MALLTECHACDSTKNTVSVSCRVYTSSLGERKQGKYAFNYIRYSMLNDSGNCIMHTSVYHHYHHHHLFIMRNAQHKIPGL